MTAVAALHWKESLAGLAPVFAGRAAAYDDSDEFVADNVAAMRDAKWLSALVPTELGGGGIAYHEMCDLVRRLGAACGPTALTLSMHQHLVAAALWNYRHGRPGEKLLRMVADGEKVLVSTGATDWLESNGTLERCDGGYRFTARKVFASGCLAGDFLVTSGRFDDPAAGPQVLHFPVSLRADGVRIDRVWQTMGMRGTGSHTVILENVFVPEQAISLRRTRGAYHPVWDVILTVALPLICAAYVGVAEGAAEIVRSSAARKGDDGVGPLLVGEMINDLTMAQIALDSMIGNASDLEFEPDIERANRALVRKTLVAEAVIRMGEKALEATGGGGYFRAMGLERLLRDIHGAQFHPLPAKKQHRFTGRLAIGLDPVR